MKVLVDTSVWIDHLRGSVEQLIVLLNKNAVVMHSAILGELACGNLKDRSKRIADWKVLPSVSELHNGDALKMIEEFNLMGKGIGLIDVHILCSAINQPDIRIWTRDQKLHRIAVELSVSFSEQAL